MRPDFSKVGQAFSDALVAGARNAAPKIAAASAGSARAVGNDIFPNRFSGGGARTKSKAPGGSSTSPFLGSGADKSAAAAAVAKGFTLPFNLQLAQAKAAATQTTKDDIAVAKKIRGYLLQIIPRLSGKSSSTRTVCRPSEQHARFERQGVRQEG